MASATAHRSTTLFCLKQYLHAAHDKAAKARAVSLKQPTVKPWGQTVSYVRCPYGTLVELCSLIAALVLERSAVVKSHASSSSYPLLTLSVMN